MYGCKFCRVGGKAKPFKLPGHQTPNDGAWSMERASPSNGQRKCGAWGEFMLDSLQLGFGFFVQRFYFIQNTQPTELPLETKHVQFIGLFKGLLR